MESFFPDIPSIVLEPETIREMHKCYGVHPSEKCGTCQFLVTNQYHTHRYFKCAKTRITHGAKTDWRKKWQACGLHKVKEEKK